MKNILLQQKKMKLWNEWHSVEKITEIMQHALKTHKFPCCPNIQNEFLGALKGVRLHM